MTARRERGRDASLTNAADEFPFDGNSVFSQSHTFN
jgi:hypothetical protein